MSNSRRWREFSTWWRGVFAKDYEDKTDLMIAINKKIEEIKKGTDRDKKNK